ncbi:MAG: NAD-dependent epimerase/dehydratase [Marmoricola sp.]|nr:NAD-dependent epimerase/dehydratase [Marmoricola sp.]
MKVFQIGAAGGIGQRLASLLVADGHEVTGMVRRPDQAGAVTATGAAVVEGDLIESSVDELAQLVAGHDAVVFSAGAHGTGRDQTTLIGGTGVEKAAAAAERAGVDRFLLVSVFPDAGRGGDPQEGFEHYMRVKKSADVHLAGTGLDWVIVRPGTLRDEPGDGLVAAGPAIAYGDVRRDNVAAFLAAVVVDPAVSREIVELTDGTTPVADAVAALHR